MHNSIPEHMQPLVSVIMPAYQAESFIEDSLRSILNQTYTHLEVFVIDDASTDSTPDIVERIADKRVRLIRKTTNSGYTSSLNMALELCTGSYIARMDADDIAHPERIAKQVAYMDQHPQCVLCGTWVNLIPQNTLFTYPVSHSDIQVRMLSANAFAHPSVLMRRSTILQYKLTYNTAFEPTEDYELWSRMMLIGEVHNIPEALLNYRVHDKQISVSQKIRQQENRNKVSQNLLHMVSPTATLAWIHFDWNKNTSESASEWLRVRYKEWNSCVKQFPHPVFEQDVIRRFVSQQKKAAITYLSQKRLGLHAKDWFSLWKTVPECFLYLGFKHSLTFTYRCFTSPMH